MSAKENTPSTSSSVTLAVTASPHVHAAFGARRIMLDVVLALLPAAFLSMYLQGWPVILCHIVSVATALACDAAWKILVRKSAYRFDGSPLVTGVLFAMSMPTHVPLWFSAIGAGSAIVVAKELFGGIGKNIFNPAVFGRGVLHVLFAAQMAGATASAVARPAVDAVSGATPLAVLKQGQTLDVGNLLRSFLGTTGGESGEISAFLLLLGAAYLFWRNIINPRIPVAMLATMAVIAWLFGGADLFSGAAIGMVAGHVLGGATILGAFYMATDYSTSPAAPNAQIWYGVGCGALAMISRLVSAHAETFTFVLLAMNLTVPLFNRYMIPRSLGEKNEKTP